MAGVRRVCLGVVAGAHGVRGLVRIMSFTETPEDLAAYGPLTDETGRRRFEVTVTGRAKCALLARIEGVTDRAQAEALRGTRLHVERAAMPEPEDAEEFYRVDLIGLDVEDRDGRRLGRVSEVYNFGAGDVLEIAGADGASLLLAFTKAVVPLVDLEAGRLVVEPPEEVAAAPD